MLGKKSPHPTADDLRDYYEARLPDLRDREVEEHLAKCPHCVRDFERNHLLQISLGDLTSGPARQVDHCGALRAALAAAAGHVARAALKRRLATWVARPAAFAGGIVQWLPGQAGPRSTGQAKWLTTFTGSSPWRFLTRPDNGAPVKKTACPSAFVRAAGPRALAVHVAHWMAGAVSPLVLLAREIGLDPAVVKQTRSDPKFHTQSAFFEGLRPGRYLLGVEPPPAPADPP